MPNYNDNNSRRSKFFYASRRTKTPSNIHKQSQKYSSKCLCDKCDVSNCQFRGQYENLHEQKFHYRDVMCGYDVDRYIENGLKEELP